MKSIHCIVLLAALLLAAPTGLVSCSNKPLLASRNADPAYLGQKARDRYTTFLRLEQEEASALEAGRPADAASYREAKAKAYQEYIEADAAAARALEEQKLQEQGKAAGQAPN
ncbi:hypothetical protein ASZ90_001185 [hydrocarbon metagenome]|uniref:Uncharacterized protein n=1 Tax=hydrocarbon metagenome TaxID=938273 RepID=A0A0W8G773_9ZZZZ